MVAGPSKGPDRNPEPSTATSTGTCTSTITVFVDVDVNVDVLVHVNVFFKSNKRAKHTPENVKLLLPPRLCRGNSQRIISRNGGRHSWAEVRSPMSEVRKNLAETAVGAC